MFAFLSVVAASYPSYLEAENFEGPMGKLSHNIVGTLFRYETSMDAMFCILNFVYKGIILEARMGTKRFFNMVCKYLIKNFCLFLYLRRVLRKSNSNMLFSIFSTGPLTF